MGTNIWQEDDRRTREYFSANLSRYGAESRAVDWGSTESQRLRFKVLSEVGDLSDASVLDVGCGIGDFCEWLQNEKIPTKYCGIDLTPEMVESARRRFPSVHFDVGTMLEKRESKQAYDFVVASGIFYLRQRSPVEYLRATVAAMFDAARIAVAFNSLSSWFEEKDPGEFYAEPLETIAYCRTLTPWVCLRHEYHARDFTVFLYRHRRMQ